MKTLTIKELYEKINDGKITSDIALQREIVYGNEKQSLVIDSVLKDIPLPAFYFWKNDDDSYEVLDGKQRIEAIKKFKQNNLTYNDKIWKEIDTETQDKINNTELTIIECSGDELKKREIFKRINTLGVPLSQYEVLNGLYNGEYLRGLTQYVSNDKSAIKVLGTQTRGSRQMKLLKYLLQEKKEKDTIGQYVEEHQNSSFEDDKKEISKYINFVAKVFDDNKNADIYFNLSIKYIDDISIWKDKKNEINDKLKLFYKSVDYKLIENKEKEIEDIIKTVIDGITTDPKRLFTQDDKLEFLKTKVCHDGKYQCEKPDGCGKWFYKEELQMDHIEAWSKGGRTVLSNAQLLCPVCNKNKGNKKSNG